jgi:hypothetical protein
LFVWLWLLNSLTAISVLDVDYSLDRQVQLRLFGFAWLFRTIEHLFHLLSVTGIILNSSVHSVAFRSIPAHTGPIFPVNYFVKMRVVFSPEGKFARKVIVKHRVILNDWLV